MHRQSIAAGRARSLPIPILVAEKSIRSTKEYCERLRTNITPDRNLNDDIVSPHDSVDAVDQVAEKKPDGNGDGGNSPRSPVPRQGREDQEAAYERDDG